MMFERRTKLVTLIEEVRANHRKKDRQIAKILRLVLEVLANPRHEQRGEMSAILRDLITTLEKEE